MCRLVEQTTGNAWLAKASNWLIAKPLSILLLIIIGIVVRWLLHRAIDKVTARAAEGPLPAIISRGRVPHMFLEANAAAAERRQQRADTMGSLLKSISTGVVAAMVVVMVIAQLGFNIAPLIASAGILGVAIGFGAQSLVKDFLSGIFMILEDQYGVGDVIDVGTATGTVEAVGLRVTRLRDVNGTVWYVRNGEILAVGNMSQNWARTVLDIPVAFSEDLSRVSEILRDVAHQMWEDAEYHPDILEEPEVWGVERWDPDGVVVRVVLKTAPLEQWSVAREMRERIKHRFDTEGIEIPLPQRMVWHRDMPDPSRRDEERSPAAASAGHPPAAEPSAATTPAADPASEAGSPRTGGV
ncbi:MAG: mechanosensitive ion channel family protein [Nocardioidaceae bacterium]|nr:mechanosensitive ion channel family protein [Nocardioidaceae bacterium]